MLEYENLLTKLQSTENFNSIYILLGNWRTMMQRYVSNCA